jgi:hypothetical protein
MKYLNVSESLQASYSYLDLWFHCHTRVQSRFQKRTL